MADKVQPGDWIGDGRYRLIELLNSGGFGALWRARDVELRVDVAIRQVLLSTDMSSAEQAERKRRAEYEALNAARLRDHPNIAAVHDVVFAHGCTWIVMQLVHGESLAQRMDREPPLSVGEVSTIATALLKALGAAHDGGVIHRDVKPANVMITKEHEVLLIDFGIARHLNDEALTQTGMFIGSPAYAAPERFRGMEATPASDLYSLGRTLYHAIEGELPQDDPFAQGVTGNLGKLINALLNKDPKKRPTVAEALDILGGPAGALPSTRVLPQSQQTRKKIEQSLGMAGVLLVALALLYTQSPAFADFLTEKLNISGNVWNARPGDCVHYLGQSSVQVPCFSASADHRVVLRPDPYQTYDGGCTFSTSWNSSTGSVITNPVREELQLCLMPKS